MTSLTGQRHPRLSSRHGTETACSPHRGTKENPDSPGVPDAPSLLPGLRQTSFLCTKLPGCTPRVPSPDEGSLASSGVTCGPLSMPRSLRPGQAAPHRAASPTSATLSGRDSPEPALLGLQPLPYPHPSLRRGRRTRTGHGRVPAGGATPRPRGSQHVDLRSPGSGKGSRDSLSPTHGAAKPGGGWGALTPDSRAEPSPAPLPRSRDPGVQACHRAEPRAEAWAGGTRGRARPTLCRGLPRVLAAPYLVEPQALRPQAARDPGPRPPRSAGATRPWRGRGRGGGGGGA